MKKVLIFMMLMSAIIASAQTGWDIKMESADPLKGTIERTRYKWQEGETTEGHQHARLWQAQ